MFPIRPLHKEDFFTSDGKIKTIICCRPYGGGLFGDLCTSAFCTWSKYFNKPLPKKIIAYPEHSMSALKRSDCLECLRLLGDQAYCNITAFRNNKEFNQYVYTMYEYFRGMIVKPPYRFKYIDFSQKSSSIARDIRWGSYSIICINDAHLDKQPRFNFQEIRDAFKSIT